MTWALVMMLPSASKMNPLPLPPVLGWATSLTCAQERCSGSCWIHSSDLPQSQLWPLSR